MMELDEKDHAILRTLQRDGSLNAAAVGKAVGLTQPSAWRRIITTPLS